MAFNGDGKEGPEILDGDHDASENIKELISEAEEGSAAARYRLGVIYQEGKGVAKDHKKAKESFISAAELIDDDFSRFCLNTLHLIGLYEDDTDHEQAAEWFRSVAEQGSADMGLGPPPEVNEEMWFKLAAMNGDVFAQRVLGLMYLDIDPPNYEGAAEWLRLAAENGDTLAQSGLGYLYENGFGVPQDRYEAARWYFRAAEQGHRGASEDLERLYEEGLIVFPDDND